MSDQPGSRTPASSASELAPHERLILALDFPSSSQALAFLDDLQNRCACPPVWVKVGLELFLSEGPRLVDKLRSQDYNIFLDLKLHDIPNTVAAAIRALGPLEVNLLTIHASGGAAMLSAAAEAAESLSRPPRLLAVTVLTSMNAQQLASIGVQGNPQEQVLRLARQAWHAGLTGLIASPQEAAMLRGEFGSGLRLVTPGIRSSGAQGGDDQQRVATPRAALLAGASQLVIGRPVTRAADPAAAYDAFLAEIANAK